jgi:hypothetical protein
LAAVHEQFFPVRTGRRQECVRFDEVIPTVNRRRRKRPPTTLDARQALASMNANRAEVDRPLADFVAWRAFLNRRPCQTEQSLVRLRQLGYHRNDLPRLCKPQTKQHFRVASAAVHHET